MSGGKVDTKWLGKRGELKLLQGTFIPWKSEPCE